MIYDLWFFCIIIYDQVISEKKHIYKLMCMFVSSVYIEILIMGSNIARIPLFNNGDC